MMHMKYELRLTEQAMPAKKATGTVAVEDLDTSVVTLF
jgi:hypothetical protein